MKEFFVRLSPQTVLSPTALRDWKTLELNQSLPDPDVSVLPLHCLDAFLFVRINVKLKYDLLMFLFCRMTTELITCHYHNFVNHCPTSLWTYFSCLFGSTYIIPHWTSLHFYLSIVQGRLLFLAAICYLSIGMVSVHFLEKWRHFVSPKTLLCFWA